MADIDTAAKVRKIAINQKIEPFHFSVIVFSTWQTIPVYFPLFLIRYLSLEKNKSGYN